MSVKLSILFRKKAELDNDAYNSYWSNEHAKVFTGLKCVRSRMARYDQYHTSPTQTATLKSMGIPIAPYDGCAEFYFHTMDDLISVITDSEYGQFVPPDLAKFLDLESCQMLVGMTERKMG
ncbi:MAG: hypothetical protein CYPHOPRED_001590 [Cyphobasidiales sp. Tagirdzhanova-0007]|nr:MAG: hypothetical protein CYPHOPRED_001590 [Cyphobasidiales sp. Tagirdzhanova-0007]